MNFQGRWWTRNGTCVAVHLTNEDAWAYWGHELRLKSPYKDDRVFNWGGEGDCKLVVGGAGVASVEPANLSVFDLMRRVNPQTIESEIECVDCESCREERKK